jgi:hypothetical protein
MKARALIGMTIEFYQANAHALSKALVDISHPCLNGTKTSKEL